jgi:membrane protein DedA with SNARE-associated domain
MLLDLFVRYGYVMVFVAATFEADATLLASTFLAHRGYLDFPLVIVVVVAATVAANQVYFWVARGYGMARLASLRSHRVYGRAIGWISRYRIALALGSRFIYGFRIAIPMASGASGMSPVVFTVIDVIGALIWAGIVGSAGYALGRVLDMLLNDLRRYEWWIAAALFVIALVLVTWERSRARRRFAKANAGVDS